jgi:ADP-dependent NAD(P)H-hydrate dehydratase / NAD(P)H-hydrate epimerase
MSVPAWLQPLPDAAEQRALDAWAIETIGTPGIELMERAGTGLAEITAQLAPTGPIVVVCGKGNNGGDGYVAARLLRRQKRRVRVLTVAPVSDLGGDARTNADRLTGAKPKPFSPNALAGATAIIDAVLGTGFSGELTDEVAEVVTAINAATGAVVVACDVPSGVDASTGQVGSIAVRADATVTFHAAKPGLWISPGKRHAGEIHVIDIGIPEGGPGEPKTGLIRDTVTAGVPRRSPASNKFATGSVLVCGGSTGLTGAPCLASEAAMRAGAGYVTACIPASLNPIFEARLLEVMTIPLPDADGALIADAVAPVLERAERVQAIVLGPGLGRDRESVAFARTLARRVSTPLVLDADGLGAFGDALKRLAGREAATVLTPHAGELGRLVGGPSEEIDARRLDAVRGAAEVAKSIVVLKGDDTLVAAPDGVVAVSRGNAPALATAGTGDVLAGVIGAYLAKGMDPFHAACAGVWVHATAGRLAAEWIGGVDGIIARDVIEALPAALAQGAAPGPRS